MRTEDDADEDDAAQIEAEVARKAPASVVDWQSLDDDTLVATVIEGCKEFLERRGKEDGMSGDAFYQQYLRSMVYRAVVG